MKKINLYITAILTVFITLTSCKNHSEKDGHEHDASGNHVAPVTNSNTPKTVGTHGEHTEEVILNQAQIDVLNIKIDTLVKRNMNGFIQVNGQLGVPPQNEAVVTSTLGANVSSIKTIEGDKVRKGQTLAYISHPDIITIQTDYLQTYNKLTFLEQDYNRQKKLYDSQVGSGRDYQQAQSEYMSAKGLVKGFESQLRLLGLSPKSIRTGNISQVAPIKSPINGFIEKVLVKSGQYVQPQTPMFEVVNTEHIHVDLMVFEKDVNKVKHGQLVKFSIEALGSEEMTAKIYSVGKSFEEGPKALHIHAEIENKDKNLIPGMYVSARVITDENLEQALPEDAVFQEGETFYVFTAEKEDNGTWRFTPQEVVIKSMSNGFVAFDFIETIDRNTLVAQSGAYYLMAEMKKSEAEHSH
ncbi:efflux RND transporter periplasmic adaptor subunit [Flavivirga spongiicola]|uniref:Efflux RND transporter periplasmic adaptor subunit n=1 Tax=Flavivirga spongiicola TaxID=421621 RepID=A0ABU7XR33_9FLAO|nr:efflux RND transporter periplasmic adaptor subunit [Flavivirga sp. MEBiC05379]MDO5978220.1 efflux RND transporter periplasmic adaptor subunit [Flavivirga sp. MEBiC05379]